MSEDRLGTIEVRLTELERDVSMLSLKVDTYADNTDEISEKIDDMHSDIKELVELWSSVKGAGNVVRWLGSGLKWVSVILVSLAAAWAAMTKGWKP